MNAPKLQFALVCDDVRREDNGKLILLGVYGQNIRIAEGPAILPIQLVVNMHLDATFEGDIEFRCLAGGNEIRRQKGRLNVTAGAAVFHVPFLLELKESAELRFEWKLAAEADWQPAFTIPFTIAHS